MRLITSYLLVSCNENKTKSTPTLSNWCSIGIAILDWSLTNTNNSSCRHGKDEREGFSHLSYQTRLKIENPYPPSPLTGPHKWASSNWRRTYKKVLLVCSIFILNYPSLLLFQPTSPSSSFLSSILLFSRFSSSCFKNPPTLTSSLSMKAPHWVHLTPLPKTQKFQNSQPPLYLTPNKLYLSLYIYFFWFTKASLGSTSIPKIF